MPYLTKEDKARLDTNPMDARNVGDYNYLFTLAFIAVWKKLPKYTTIHELRRASVNPGLIQEVVDVESCLTALGVSFEDRQAARYLAFLEFYRRIGSRYEDTKIAENGDVYAEISTFEVGGLSEELKLKIAEVAKGAKK